VTYHSLCCHPHHCNYRKEWGREIHSFKILAGLISSTRGSISYARDQKPLGWEEFKRHVGFVAPYLNFYDEFTALENLRLLDRIRGVDSENEGEIKELLTLVNLWQRRDDLVGTFSSGMKQRLKYAFALIQSPSVLILDEPITNLDAEGIEFAHHVMSRQKEKGILIIAANSRQDSSGCDQEIQLGMSMQ